MHHVCRSSSIVIIVIVNIHIIIFVIVCIHIALRFIFPSSPWHTPFHHVWHNNSVGNLCKSEYLLSIFCFPSLFTSISKYLKYCCHHHHCHIHQTHVLPSHVQSFTSSLLTPHIVLLLPISLFFFITPHVITSTAHLLLSSYWRSLVNSYQGKTVSFNYIAGNTKNEATPQWI